MWGFDMWTMTLKGGLGSLDLNPPEDSGFVCEVCGKGKREDDMFDDDICHDCDFDRTEKARKELEEEKAQEERDRAHEAKLKAMENNQ